MANDNLNSISAMAGRVEAGATVQWLARAKAMGWTAEMAQSLGAPRQAVAVLKSMTTSTLEGAGASAVAAFAEQAAPQSAFMRLIAEGAFQSAPLRAPLLTAAADATATLVGEGNPIAMTEIGLDDVTLTPEKAATILVATREAWAQTDAAGQAFINRLLREAIGKVADGRMFTTLEASPALSFTADPATASEVVAAFQSALGALLTAAGQRFRWIASPAAVATLAPLDLGRNVSVGPDGGEIFKVPLAVSSSLAPGDLILLRTSDIAARLIDLEIDASTQATIEEDGEGSGGVSLFGTNRVGIRAILAYAITPLADEVMARISLTEGS